MTAAKTGPLPPRGHYRPPSPLKDPYISTIEVRGALGGVDATTLRRLMLRDPSFPRPIRLTGNRNAWRLSAIEKWIASRPVGYQPKNGGAR